MTPARSTDTDTSAEEREGRFLPTRWSLVREAGRRGSPQAEAALAQLCEIYWYPLYLYVRRLGHSAEDAQDVTQAFFARLMDKNYIALAEREKGKFRSFLLTALKRFLINEWDRTNRQKRGGGRQILSLDEENSENRYLAEPADQMTPEKAFDRRWAMTLLERVLNRLEADHAAAGKATVFAELRILLTGEKSDSSYAEMAERLQLSEGTLKVTVHRLRQRYAELVRKEIAHTLTSHEEVDDEMRHLFSALS